MAAPRVSWSANTVDPSLVPSVEVALLRVCAPLWGRQCMAQITGTSKRHDDKGQVYVVSAGAHVTSVRVARALTQCWG